jgi:cell division septation protein DedD
MKTNSLLTYLLYAVLATLVLAAGYKACQMQKEKQLKAQEQAEWQETLKKMYPATDSAGGGSAYIGNGENTQPAVSKDGIEDDAGKTGSTKSPATSDKQTAPVISQPVAPKETTPQTTSKTTTTTTKGSTPVVAGPGSGRWEVRAGTFTYLDGARERLEQVIKMGYTNAEIGKTNGGKYAVVVVLRTNDKARAIQVGDQLEKRGIDAFVHDRNKK